MVAVDKILYFLPLASSAILNIIVSVIIYILYFRKNVFEKIGYWKSQIIIGLIYGLCTIYATEIGGIDIGSAVINARNAAPLSAGLLFGAPAGVIAGLIGGTERWFAVYWGVGVYTRLACTIGCYFAGGLAALFNIFVFRKEKPSPAAAAIIALVCEVIHITFVFITHFTDPNGAFAVVKVVTFPIILATVSSVGITFVIVTLLDRFYRKKDNIVIEKKLPTVSSILQQQLFLIVVVMFMTSMFFEYAFLKNAAVGQAERTIKIVLEDAREEFIETDKYHSGEIVQLSYSWHVGENGGIIVVDEDYNAIPYINTKYERVYPDFKISNKKKLKENRIFEATYNGEDVLCVYININQADNPIEDDYRKIIGYMPEEEVYSNNQMAMYLTTFILIIIMAALFVLIYSIISNLFVQNVEKVNNSLEKITDGDLSTEVNVRDTLEFDLLSNSLNSMVNALKNLIVEAKRRIAEELEFAKKIQFSTLPTKFQQYKKLNAFDIYATMDTAKEVGGDFYDFYFYAQNKFMFLIADVSGKGIPGAMFMMKAKSIIKSASEMSTNLEDIITQANNELCENNDAEMFVTCFAVSIDINTGEAEFVSAGHNPPIFISSSGCVEYLNAKANLVLAGMENIKYKKGTIKFNPNDAIYLYTDGVTEAININKELYGEDRLLTVVKNNAIASSIDLCHNIKEDLDCFVGNVEQFDDITMLAFRYKGVSNMKEITVSAEVKNVDKVTDFVNAELEKANCPHKAIMEIDVAIDELFSNIANYAYHPEVGQATVQVDISDNSVTIAFLDNGKPFDPLAKKDPNVKETLEERNIGGLGIFMVKKSMDSVDYKYEDGKNILTIKKNI